MIATWPGRHVRAALRQTRSSARKDRRGRRRPGRHSRTPSGSGSRSRTEPLAVALAAQSSGWFPARHVILRTERNSREVGLEHAQLRQNVGKEDAEAHGYVVPPGCGYAPRKCACADEL